MALFQAPQVLVLQLHQPPGLHLVDLLGLELALLQSLCSYQLGLDRGQPPGQCWMLLNLNSLALFQAPAGSPAAREFARKELLLCLEQHLFPLGLQLTLQGLLLDDFHLLQVEVILRRTKA